MAKQAYSKQDATGKVAQRSRNHPLTLHPTGQYGKKIRGHMFYFGTDWREALQRYHEQPSLLHTGRGKPRETPTDLPLQDLANLFLDHQHSRVAIQEIGERHFSDQVRLLRDFVSFVGPKAKAGEISTFQI